MGSEILNPFTVPLNRVRNSEPFFSLLNGVRNSEPFSSPLNGVRNSEPFSFPAEWGQKFWTFFLPRWMGSEILNLFPTTLNGVRNCEPFSFPVEWGQKFWTLFLPRWMGSDILNSFLSLLNGMGSETLIAFPYLLYGVRNSEPFSFPVQWGQKFWTLFLPCWMRSGWWHKSTCSLGLILQFRVNYGIPPWICAKNLYLWANSVNNRKWGSVIL